VGTVCASTISVSNYASSFTALSGDYAVYASKDVSQSLPVNWVAFSAEKGLNNAVNLAWTVSNQVNNDHFDVERSFNGTSFTHVATVGASANIFNNTTYNFIDYETSGGTIYYRIKQVDNNGRYSYSKIIAVTLAKKEGIVRTSIIPNQVNIVLQTSVNKMNIVMSDISGKRLYQQTLSNLVNAQKIAIPTSLYSKGVYLINIYSDKGNQTEKVIIE
jgi:hypothetical protein